MAAAVPLDTSKIKALINNLDARHNVFNTNLGTVQTQIHEESVVLYDVTGDENQIKDCRVVFEDMRKLTCEIQAYQRALKSLTQPAVYNPTSPDTTTDFRALLKSRMQAELAAAPFNPSTDVAMQKFDQETGLAQNRELGEDEDLMMVSGTANNTRCPITMKLVEELEDPVEDKHGYIYERSAIVDMITRQRGGAVKCPIMGTSHFVSVGELKAAKRKPSKRANNQQRADIDEEIIDA